MVCVLNTDYTDFGYFFNEFMVPTDYTDDTDFHSDEAFLCRTVFTDLTDSFTAGAADNKSV